MREVTPIADYFILCNGTSARQLKAISQKIVEGIKKEEKKSPARIEGEAEGGWILIDYGDVVIHAFLPEQREYYDLETLWSNAKTLLRMQ